MIIYILAAIGLASVIILVVHYVRKAVRLVFSYDRLIADLQLSRDNHYTRLTTLEGKMRGAEIKLGKHDNDIVITDKIVDGVLMDIAVLKAKKRK